MFSHFTNILVIKKKQEKTITNVGKNVETNETPL